MNFINRAFDRYVQARQIEARRYVNAYLTKRGLEPLSFEQDRKQG